MQSFCMRDVSVTPSKGKFHLGGILAENRSQVLSNPNLTAQGCLSMCPVKVIGVRQLDAQSEKDVSLCLTTRS